MYSPVGTGANADEEGQGRKRVESGYGAVSYLVLGVVLCIWAGNYYTDPTTVASSPVGWPHTRIEVNYIENQVRQLKLVEYNIRYPLIALTFACAVLKILQFLQFNETDNTAYHIERCIEHILMGMGLFWCVMSLNYLVDCWALVYGSLLSGAGFVICLTDALVRPKEGGASHPENVPYYVMGAAVQLIPLFSVLPFYIITCTYTGNYPTNSFKAATPLWMGSVVSTIFSTMHVGYIPAMITTSFRVAFIALIGFTYMF